MFFNYNPILKTHRLGAHRKDPGDPGPIRDKEKVSDSKLDQKFLPKSDAGVVVKNALGIVQPAL